MVDDPDSDSRKCNARLLKTKDLFKESGNSRRLLDPCLVSNTLCLYRLSAYVERKSWASASFWVELFVRHVLLIIDSIFDR